jgi:sugar/nucleoside kinase (ribokinase family)
MPPRPDILCIGSVLWDIIGRSPAPMRPGADVPGLIRRQPGGVAMNVAAALRRHGLVPALLTAVGRDADGAELLAACDRLGLVTAHVHLAEDLPTDRYIAIEDAGGLVAAIADARSLETAGAGILRPLEDGRLGSAMAPWSGQVVLDGNLTEALLARIAGSPLLARADLRVVPASPGKAGRIAPLLGHARATFYVNLEEAGILLGGAAADAAAAARALVERGATRALVTDGARPAAFADAQGTITAAPPVVTVRRVTGAGDALMAAHIAAERRGAGRAEALAAALAAAAGHVSGESG